MDFKEDAQGYNLLLDGRLYYLCVTKPARLKSCELFPYASTFIGFIKMQISKSNHDNTYTWVGWLVEKNKVMKE